MTSDKEVWRWNVDPAWENYSSLHLESSAATRASNPIEKYHHLRAALLFGMASLEAFLNQEMRKKMIAEGRQDNTIAKQLKTFLGNKTGKWPQIISSKELAVDTNLERLVREYNDLRGETAHPQRREHSFYKALDDMAPDHLRSSVAHYMISITQALNRPFYYWLLGWNFVGFNFDEAAPCLLDNQQFLHSLRNGGLQVPAWEYSESQKWERENMVTLENFERMIKLMDTLPFDIEPRQERFPQRPRLCKRWWDKNLIRSS